MHVQVDLHSAAIATTTRFGQINFVNCLPINVPIAKGIVPIHAQITYETPANLNARFRDGLLDVGAMSSHYYLASQSLTLIPDVSISSKGPVGSVLFFSKKSLNQKDLQSIVVSESSLTSVNLLKLMLAEEYGLDFRAIEIKAKQDPDLDSVDAALVIGDLALKVDKEWSVKYQRIDLGQWWFERYRMPIVFGVWAAGTKWVKEHKNEFDAIVQSLSLAVKRGLTDQLPTVVEEAEKRTGLEKNRLYRYFQNELNYELNAEHLEGLELYAKLCKSHRI